MTGLSINHYLAPAGYSLTAFLDEAAAAGASGVGLTERSFAEIPVATLKPMLRERGLSVTSVNSAGFFLWGNPERARQQRSINTSLIQNAAELAADTVVLIGGGLHDFGPEDDITSLSRARSTFESELPAIIDEAERHGVRLGVEPMHPIRIFTKATLNTLAQTAALCDRHPKLGVVLDLFHCWWDPDLEPMLERLATRLTLVQLCGVVQPRQPELLPKRCLLREGVADVGGMLEMLHRFGYAKSFEFELFAHDLDGRTVSDTMRAVVNDFATLARGTYSFAPTADAHRHG
ncbi:sugar phosphate isomerase/epimerase family protein [Tardiphaga sp.]|uniref:sugar phosphate isomerase/epimerase family protein n=1 Tax=Tardiphaga sp. TaxID=1926292 RepID=UPI0025D641CB|nr:sugar phosphate isomerase/epimerase family protein [Tardiphaga sp.]